jgi:hypothetical protein
MKVPVVTVGPAIDARDQPEAPSKTSGPSVLLTFENVRHEDRKVLMTRLRKHDGYLKLDARMLEDKSGLVVSAVELVSLQSFSYSIVTVVRATCLSFNAKIVVRSEVVPLFRSTASVL